MQFGRSFNLLPCTRAITNSWSPPSLRIRCGR